MEEKRKEVAYVGIGSNIGDRSKNLREAILEIKRMEKTTLLRISSFYETEPIGLREQPFFLNAVIEIDTEIPPEELLFALKKIEKKMGREKGVKGGPRVIDLDILFYGEKVLYTPVLEIPHPHIEKRRFVLLPLLEITPNHRHPKTGKSIREMLFCCPEQICRVLENSS